MCQKFHSPDQHPHRRRRPGEPGRDGLAPVPDGLPLRPLRAVPELLLRLPHLLLAALALVRPSHVLRLEEAEEVRAGLGQGLAGGARVGAAPRGRTRAVTAAR